MDGWFELNKNCPKRVTKGKKIPFRDKSTIFQFPNREERAYWAGLRPME